MPSFFRYGQKIQAVRLVSPAGWFKLCSFVLLLMWMSVGEVHVSLAQSSAQESSALSKEVEQSQTQAGTDTKDTDRVDSSRLPTGRSLQPHGLSLEFHGRPVDLVVYKNWLLVKDRGHLRVVDIETWKEIQVLRSRGGASLTGLCVDRDGVVYFSNSKQEVHRFETTGDTAKPYRFRDSIQFRRAPFHAGWLSLRIRKSYSSVFQKRIAWGLLICQRPKSKRNWRPILPLTRCWSMGRS